MKTAIITCTLLTALPGAMCAECKTVADRKSGNGKAVMQINASVDPYAPSYGEPTLSIRAPWSIQADDTPNGTVGLIAVKEGVETVWILHKNSHTILKKFTRQP